MPFAEEQKNDCPLRDKRGLVMMEFIEENWLIFSIVCGFVAKSVGRSFWKYFFLSLLLSPILGFVVLLIKGKKTDEQVVVNHYEAWNDSQPYSSPSQANSATPSGEPRFCSACGAEIEPNAKFCSYCGNPVQFD